MKWEKAERIKAARHAIYEAEKQRDQLLAELFPVGTPVLWKRGRNTFGGIVVDPPKGRQLYVRNNRTGSQLYIRDYDILGVLS